MACRKAGLAPGRDFDLSSIRVVPIAGSPLPPEGYDYIYEQLGPDVLLVNGSGGTDVCSAIVSGSALQPVAPRRDGRALAGGRRHGVRRRRPRGDRRARGAGDPPADAVDARAASGTTQATSATATRTSACTRASGVRATGCGSPQAGTCIVAGRSDATLNRGGVRLGTGEFYAVIEELPEVQDSLVVHLEDPDGGPGELLLFVVADLDDDLRRADHDGAALAPLAAACPGRDRRGAGDPAHADREEARGAGQAHPARRAGGGGRESGRARRTRRARRLRALCPGSADLVTLGAAELARAIAAGELSARAAVQAEPGPDRGGQRRAQRGHGGARRRGARRGGRGRRAPRPRRTGAAAARRPVHGQGEHRRRGDGDVARACAAACRRSATRRTSRTCAPRARSRSRGRTFPDLALRWHTDNARHGATVNPLGRVAEPGREQRRRCGRAGERHGRVRGRQRLRRLVARAGGARRRVRAAPDAGAPRPGVRRRRRS